MAKHNTSDRIWGFAMKRTHRDGKAITARELSQMAQCSERTARDRLKTMEDLGILVEEKKGRNVRYIPEWNEYDPQGEQ